MFLPPYATCMLFGMESTELTLDEYQRGAHTTAQYPRVYTEEQVRALAHQAANFGRAISAESMVDNYITELLDTYTTEFSKLVYPVLGLLGEAGEIANKLKKVARDQEGVPTWEQVEDLTKELGDTMWYEAEVATALEVPLSIVCEENLDKLRSRVERGVLHGSGDNR